MDNVFISPGGKRCSEVEGGVRCTVDILGVQNVQISDLSLSIESAED